MTGTAQILHEAVATRERPSVVMLIASMIALAGLDLLGAMLARSWADHRSVVTLVAGIAVFGLLFVVYGNSLSSAELSTVTVGWIVMLQIGVLVLERLDGVTIPVGKVLAVVAILALQTCITASDLHS